MRQSPEETATELLKAGVIDASTADRIRAYYAAQAQFAGSKSKLPAAFAIIGSVFLGIGLLLLIAHNWQDLPRPVKVCLAFVPLLGGQVLALHTFFRRFHSPQWREISSIVVFIGVGASFSLLSQTYHLGGQLHELLLVWSLLSLPIVFLMRSVLVGLLAALVVIWHDLLLVETQGLPILGLATSIAYILFILYLKRTNRPSYLIELYRFTIALLVVIPFFGWFRNSDSTLAISYIALFGALLGLSYSGLLRAPFSHFDSWVFLSNIGLGVIVIAQFILYRISSYFHEREFIFNIQTGVVFGLLSAAYAYFGLRWLIRAASGQRWQRPLLFLPVLLMAVELLGRWGNFGFAYALLNLGLIALSGWLVYLGFRLSSYAQLNHGLVTALLISINFFFETDLSYTLRGLVFIVVGSGFIVANVLLSRNKARKSGQTNITLPPDTK